MHHPVEFLKDFDRESVKIEFFRNFDALFTGHVHELASSYTSDLNGSLFISIANSSIGDFPTERKFINGYTILDIIPGKSIKTEYRKYIEIHNRFVPNTDIGTEDGKKNSQF
ncbi:MAG: hypothetical protein IPP79_14095 [Chitinophagaceae bacterium]|nr:hypothetical protein [Chitinophagaceae bacterium]